ncbi:MAG: hypothetical protein ACREQ5_21230 [Candidatus Dormibacteria bacterium]
MILLVRAMRELEEGTGTGRPARVLRPWDRRMRRRVRTALRMWRATW